MAVTALSKNQQQADAHRAAAFMRSARDRLLDVPNVTQPQNQYTLSYDACHDIGEALLAAYGYKTVNGPGQHEALGRFLRGVLDAPPANAAASRFDALRQARNKQHYAAKPVTAADALVAQVTAQELYAAAIQMGLTT